MFKDANGKIIDVTEHPGYLKLIKERSRTETPQETVKFNLYEHDEHLGMTPMEYALKELETFAMIGGYSNRPFDGIAARWHRIPRMGAMFRSVPANSGEVFIPRSVAYPPFYRRGRQLHAFCRAYKPWRCAVKSP